MADILTEQDYQTILKNYSNQNVTFLGAKQVTLSENCEGFMGDYFVLELVYLGENNQENKEKFFVKTLPTHTDLQGEMATIRNVYGKEIFFYDFLIKQYEEYGLDTSFCPKCYLCKDNKILILENLINNQYKLSEKNILYDLEQIKLGLKALALYHSASIIYEEKLSEKLGKSFRLNEQYPDLFKENYFDYNDEVFGKRVIIETAAKIEYVLQTYLPDKHVIFKRYFDSKQVLNRLLGPTKSRKATGHGDTWYNNIFFNKNGCKIVDYQILRYSLPAFDVLLFIHLNTSKEFRAEHLPDLILFYHQTITEIFQQHAYDISEILPLQEFQETVSFTESVAIFTALSIGMLVFLPEDIMEKFYGVLGNDKENWSDVHFTFVKKALESKPEFKKLVLDAVCDFCDSLSRNNNQKFV